MNPHFLKDSARVQSSQFGFGLGLGLGFSDPCTKARLHLFQLFSWLLRLGSPRVKQGRQSACGWSSEAGVQAGVPAMRKGSSAPSYKPEATPALMVSVMGQCACSGCLGSTPDFAIVPGSGTWEHCGKIHLKAKGLLQLWLLLVALL